MNRSYWVPAVLLSLSSNLDNVGVGVAYGIRRVRVPFTSNLVIALITASGTLAAMLAGTAVGSFLNPRIASLLGGSILIALGGWVLFQESQTPRDSESLNKLQVTSDASESSLTKRVFTILNNPFSADQDFSRHIDTKEAMLLGIALSLNNLVNGLAAGILRLSPALVTTLVMVFSVLTLWAGMSAGYRYCSRWLGRYVGVVSGLLLIAIGLYQVFG